MLQWKWSNALGVTSNELRNTTWTNSHSSLHSKHVQVCLAWEKSQKEKKVSLVQRRPRQRTRLNWDSFGSCVYNSKDLLILSKCVLHGKKSKKKRSFLHGTNQYMIETLRRSDESPTNPYFRWNYLLSPTLFHYQTSNVY